MKIKLLGSAQKDLVDGWHFYEKQCVGVGDYFLDTIYCEIESLQLYAGIHEKHFGYFRMLSKKFPFAVYYKIKNQEIILVDAVLHTKRDPKKLNKRLDKIS